MRVKSMPRRAFASALVLAVTFGGTALAFAPAAHATGPTSLGVSGWQVYSNTNLYANLTNGGWSTKKGSTCYQRTRVTAPNVSLKALTPKRFKKRSLT